MTSTDLAAPTTLTIRTATPRDAELVDRLVREIAAHEDSLNDVASGPDQWRTMLARADVRVFIAVNSNGEPLGYASTTRRLVLWLGADVIGLDDLWVRKQARNQGVGRCLMTAVAALAATDRLTIVWGAEPDNVDAHRFYRRLGANLRSKVVASWAPDHYLPALPH